MKKVLLLTNFSPASRHAIEFARSFFGDTAADFHLLYPHQAEPDGIQEPRYVADTTRVRYMNQLTETIDGLPNEVMTDWQTFPSSGKAEEPYDIVAESVETETYDLVVIGPSQDGTDTVFGNSAITLISRIKATVLVVPAEAAVRPILQIVLAVDFANLTNYQLLEPLRDLVLLKGATLTLLTIDTPGKKIIHVEHETEIRQYLRPIEPMVARLQAQDAKQGIDDFLANNRVDLLVTIPRYKRRNPAATASPGWASAFTPSVPLLTIYDETRMEQPEQFENLSDLDFAL